MARKIRFSLISAGVVLTFAGSSLAVGTPAVAASAKPIVQVTSVGGFVAPSWQASRLPQLLISSDGTAIVENQKPAHGYVRQALALKLSNSTVKSFLGKLSTALQTPQGGWGMPPVADMPNTRVQAVINGTKLDVTIDAFSYLGNGLTPAQLKARKTLTVLLNGLESSVTRAKQSYKPAKYEIWGLTQVIDNGGVGIANPASVYCASIGGTTNIVDSGNGQVGYCQLPSGENVEEWANFRSAMATLPAWPEKLALPSDPNDTGMSCSAVSAAAISKQLANKDDGGRWLLPSGQALPVVLRPILPGESACHRSW
jgi:putative hemolysin